MIIERHRSDTMTVHSDGSKLVYERSFAASRELVWKAFTDPDLVPRWWGPNGSTTTVIEMDVRPGGTWRYRSSAPDRDDVTFHGEYLEIEAPWWILWTFLFEVAGLGDQGGPESFLLEEIDGRTRVTTRSDFGSIEALEGALATGMIVGAIETWDRLEALLTER